MAHLRYSNYPAGVDDRSISRYFGPDWSDAALDAHEVHARAQTLLVNLLECLKANEDEMGMGIYEALRAEGENALRNHHQIEDMLADEEADRREDARLAAADERYQRQRDESF